MWYFYYGVKTNCWNPAHYLPYFCEIYTAGNGANVFALILRFQTLSVATPCLLTPSMYTSSNKNITFFHTHVIHKQHINASPWSCAHAHCSMSDKHRKAAGNMQLFIITMRRIARSASLRCHWDLTATSACMLFIYTSYKSVSPDLQCKLCQASWEITGCECASAKSSRRKAGAFKQNYSTFSYSNETCSKCTCMYINLHQTNQLPNEIHMFSFSFFGGGLFWGQSFHLPLLTRLPLHQTNQGGREDKNRKKLLTILYPSPPCLCPTSSPSSLPNHLGLTQVLLFLFFSCCEWTMFCSSCFGCQSTSNQWIFFLIPWTSLGMTWK